jgi:hypothetical protein
MTLVKSLHTVKLFNCKDKVIVLVLIRAFLKVPYQVIVKLVRGTFEMSSFPQFGAWRLAATPTVPSVWGSGPTTR